MLSTGPDAHAINYRDRRLAEPICYTEIGPGEEFDMARFVSGSGPQERITRANSKLLSREATKLRQGSPSAARILVEELGALREGVRGPWNM